MKKMISLLLAVVMICSLAAVASAAEGVQDTDVNTSKPAVYDAVIKTYDLVGSTDDKLFPDETLEFTSAADTANPDGGAANLTIDDLDVAGNTNQKLTIHVPAFTKVGTYHFTISETAGSSQGVDYTTAGTIAVSVLVTYDYEDADGDDYLLTATVGLTSDEGAKDGMLTNTYKVGSLAVSKKVTGNLGDTSKVFTAKVTFKAEDGKTVNSAITYTDDAAEMSIAGGWTGTKEATVTLKHGETVTFHNIPEGVTYTVTENDYTGGEKNGENGYDAAVYNKSDDTMKIAAGDADTVEIVNNKSTTVDTGIVLDSMPYILLLAAAVCGLVLFAAKKRAYE